MSLCTSLQKILDGLLEHARTLANGSDPERTLTNAVYQMDCTFCLAALALMTNEIGLALCQQC